MTTTTEETVSDVLYIEQMAKRLSRTETAIRAAVNRDVDWLPKSFKLGRRIAWRASDVDAFLAKKAASKK